MDYDLTDRGWVDFYVKKCDSIMKEFTNYVYALQNHCVKERDRREQLDRDCKHLQTSIKKFTDEKNKPQKSSDVKTRTELANIAPLGITAIKTPEADADRTTISDGSPAFLDMAMDSEQLQIGASCILSPAQHRHEIIPATEQLSSPNLLSIPMHNIFQHNTSPTCKLRDNNENKSALGFLKARGRIGKVLYDEPREKKLREHNCSTDAGNLNSLLLENKGKLKAKRSDWLCKDAKDAERRATVKRAATVIDDIQRKRGHLSLNKSGERKLKQSRLTQIVGKKLVKAQNKSTSTSPKNAADAQKFSFSPITPATSRIKKKLGFTSYPSHTDDIFHFSSDDEDEESPKKSVNADIAVYQNGRNSIDATFLQPLPHEIEKSESVLAITPTAPPIICLDESEKNETDTEIKPQYDKIKRKEVRSKEKITQIKQIKQEKPNTEKLPSALAAAMLAEWDEEDEDSFEDGMRGVKAEMPSIREDTEKTPDLKPRRSQIPVGKISIKECFNVDCAACQKFIDFMGSNMSMAEIEAHLRRCALHRQPKECIPVTPPDYWNPLMHSFSESDPRNKTLLVDPCLQHKRIDKKS